MKLRRDPASGPRIHRYVLGFAALGLTLMFGLSACSSEEAAEEDTTQDSAELSSDTEAAEGVAWVNGSFDEALAMARDADKMLLVDVWSSHCAQCGIMDEELWKTADGAELVGDAIAVKVPSDDPESYTFRNTYPITGLPTILLLDSSGNEIDRVVGYVNRSQFLSEAYGMMTGVDPIPELKASIEADPSNPALCMTLMEKYLNRTNETEASRMKDRILELDPDNAGGHAEKALREMARYYAFFHMDAAGSAYIYRSLVELYPSANSLNSALKATLNHSKSLGQVSEWTEWICEQTKKNPENSRLNTAVALYAFRNGVKDACLAEAARQSLELGGAPAGMDTVAVALAGGS